METKKVLAVIFSLVFLSAFAFVLTWGIINFEKVKESMSGTQLYTNEDLQDAYQDGYDTALQDKNEYDELINSYRDTITSLNDNISSLNSQITNLNKTNEDYKTQQNNLNQQKANLEAQVDNLTQIKTSNEQTIDDLNKQISTLQKQVSDLTESNENKDEQISKLNEQITTLQSLVTQLQTTNDLNVVTITNLNNQIASLNSQISDMTLQIQNNSTNVSSLNNKIAELEKSVAYYEQYIANLESTEQVVATFEFNGSVYNIQIVNKNDIVSVTTPTSTDYVIFNYWTVDGVQVDLSTYNLTTNTKFIANVTYKYDVIFTVDGENYNSQIVLKDSTATQPNDPTKSGYVFDGWTVDGTNEIDLTTYTITNNTTFMAKFSKLYSVVFMYEDSVVSTQTIKNGNVANPVETVSTSYKVFNGWKVNNTIVDIETYKITADTTFVADITYKYNVTFVVDETTYNTQIIVKNSYAELPENPQKDKYVFLGWSVNGDDIVDVSSYLISENTTFTALFKLDKLEVTFKDGDTILTTEQVSNGDYATAPTIDKDTFMGWTINGTDIIDVSSYQITEDVIFVAKYGTWTLVQDSPLYIYSDAYSSKKQSLTLKGLKAGEKIKCEIDYIKLNVDESANGSVGYNSLDGNGCYGFVYQQDGSWYQLKSSNGTDGNSGSFVITSDKPYTANVGLVNYTTENVLTLSICCEKDDYFTYEISDQIGMYIETGMFWYFYALR